jgi:hypothetical protein
MIKNYNDFVRELLKSGFSMASGGNDEGIFGLIEHGWNDQHDGSPLRWHTGDPEADPWEWRMRVLDERDDIAYAKLFFRKAGYLTKEWYPCFLAARRSDKTFADAYSRGTVSQTAKRIYEAVADSGSLPLHEIKEKGGFGKEEKSAFDSALTELQMRMYLTICGRRQKSPARGENDGWQSTVLCTTEEFFGEDVFEKAAGISPEEAAEKITEQVLLLNPLAKVKKIDKFIKG